MASQIPRPSLDAFDTPSPSAKDLSSSPAEESFETLNAQAERCRRLASATYNREVSKMLDNMAEAFERTAERLARPSGP